MIAGEHVLHYLCVYPGQSQCVPFRRHSECLDQDRVRLGQLYGGDFGLVGTDASGTGEPLGTLLWWRRGMHDFVSHAWHPIGGPGASFAVTPDTVYGLTPDRTVFGLTPDHGAVYRYDGTGTSWTQVGGPAAAIFAFNEEVAPDP